MTTFNRGETTGNWPPSLAVYPWGSRWLVSMVPSVWDRSPLAAPATWQRGIVPSCPASPGFVETVECPPDDCFKLSHFSVRKLGELALPPLAG